MMFALPAILDQQGIQDLVNPRYCPQDNTGFYTFDVNMGFDEINYCEHIREKCVTETVIDKTNIEIPSFLPTDSALWLDADDSSTITLVSGAVSEWRDKSGNNRHATQATAGNRPLLVANGLNGTDVIRFDGVDDILTCVNYDYSFQSVFIVFSRNSNTYSFDGLLGLRIASSSIVPNSVSIISLLLNAWDTTADWYFSSSSLIFKDGLEIPSSSKTSPFSSTQRFFNTTVNQYNLIYAEYATNSGDGIKNLCIGADPFTGNGNRYGQGDISQIIIFPRVLTQSEREQMEGYLAWSTGLQGNLPVGHPYKDSYTGVTVTETTTCTDFYDFAQAP